MRTQKRIGLGWLAVASGVALAMSSCSDANKDRDIKFTDCPPAVQKAIVNFAGDVSFSTVERETRKGGRILYEAKGKRPDGMKVEIKVAGDGSLVEFKSDQAD